MYHNPDFMHRSNPLRLLDQPRRRGREQYWVDIEAERRHATRVREGSSWLRRGM
jgi:hypothetical protein